MAPQTNEGFLTDLNTALLFFRYCKQYNIDDAKKRIEIMRRIVAKKKAKYLPYPEEFLKGKTVVKLENKANES